MNRSTCNPVYSLFHRNLHIDHIRAAVLRAIRLPAHPIVAVAAAIVVAVDVDLDVLAFARSFRRVRAEVPVAVQRVDGVLDALPQHTLAGLVAQHIGREQHLDAEYPLRRLGRCSNVDEVDIIKAAH